MHAITTLVNLVVAIDLSTRVLANCSAAHDHRHKFGSLRLVLATIVLFWQAFHHACAKFNNAILLGSKP